MLTGMTVESYEPGMKVESEGIFYTLIHVKRKEFLIETHIPYKKRLLYSFLVDGFDKDEWYQAAKHEFVDFLRARGVAFPEGMKPGLR